MPRWLSLTIAIITFGTINSTAFAQDSSTSILRELATFARDICESPPLKSSENSLELSVEGKASLNKLLSKIATLDGNVSGRIKQSEVVGVLQKDLASSLENANTCRREVVSKFANRLFPKRSTLDSYSQSQLARARRSCNDAKFGEARAIYDSLFIAYPDHQQIRQVRSFCNRIEEEDVYVQIYLLRYPAVFVYGQGNSPFRASISPSFKYSSCDRLSNKDDSSDVTCDAKPGRQNFSFNPISLYDPYGRLIFTGGECSGQVEIKPSEKALYAVLCFRKPYIRCGLVTGDEIQNFNSSKCPFS